MNDDRSEFNVLFAASTRLSAVQNALNEREAALNSTLAATIWLSQTIAALLNRIENEIAARMQAALGVGPDPNLQELAARQQAGSIESDEIHALIQEAQSLRDRCENFAAELEVERSSLGEHAALLGAVREKLLPLLGETAARARKSAELAHRNLVVRIEGLRRLCGTPEGHQGDAFDQGAEIPLPVDPRCALDDSAMALGMLHSLTEQLRDHQAVQESSANSAETLKALNPLLDELERVSLAGDAQASDAWGQSLSTMTSSAKNLLQAIEALGQD